jgi:beta-lactam-binding protein with PASTA domain
VTTASSETVAAGLVISQNPAGGGNVPPGTAVDLVVSLGVAPVAVPNVVGLTQAAATTAIGAANLTLGEVTTASSETVDAGLVISQNPAAGGANVPPGTAVDLVVSTGPAPVAVPNVVGLTQAAATTAIGAAGLTLGEVTTASSETVLRAT